MADGVQSLTKLGTQEYFWNYYELDNGYIDLNADYWDQSAIEALSIANHLYYITGEAIVSDNAATWAMYYNKDLLADNGLQNPVELVDAGTWTIDALYEMCKAVATKVSTGDTMSYDPADGDIWGHGDAGLRRLGLYVGRRAVDDYQGRGRPAHYAH